MTTKIAGTLMDHLGTLERAFPKYIQKGIAIWVRDFSLGILIFFSLSRNNNCPKSSSLQEGTLYLSVNSSNLS